MLFNSLISQAECTEKIPLISWQNLVSTMYFVVRFAIMLIVRPSKCFSNTGNGFLYLCGCILFEWEMAILLCTTTCGVVSLVAIVLLYVTVLSIMFSFLFLIFACVFCTARHTTVVPDHHHHDQLSRLTDVA